MGYIYGVSTTLLGTLYMDVNGDKKKDKLELVAMEQYTTSGKSFSQKQNNKKIFRTEIGVGAVHINTGTTAKPIYKYLNNLRTLRVVNRKFQVGNRISLGVWRPKIKSFYSEGLTTLKKTAGKRCATVTLRLAVKTDNKKVIGSVGTRYIKLCIHGKGKNIRLVSSKPPVKKQRKP